MTASLFARALYHGCCHVLHLAGLSLLQRLVLVALKAVAISGYYWGKLLSSGSAAPKAPQQPACSRVQAAAPVAAPLTAAFHGSYSKVNRALPAADTAAPPVSSSLVGSTSSAVSACRRAGPAAVVVVPAWIKTARHAHQLHRLVVRLLHEQVQPPSAVVIVDDCGPVRVCSLLGSFTGDSSGEREACGTLCGGSMWGFLALGGTVRPPRTIWPDSGMHAG